MKKVDIRKIYICEIERISKLYEQKTDEDEYASLMGRKVVIGKKIRRFYETAEQDKSYGLFIKGMTGYKHILTDTKYKIAGRVFMNEGEYVINPESIELFVKKERDLAIKLIQTYSSYEMDFITIKQIEEKLNNEGYIKQEDTLNR